MKSIRFSLSKFRPLRLLFTLGVCALLIFSNAFPAFAAPSNPTKGEEQLLGIEKKSQETTLEQPMSLQETEAETNPGLNEIQGTADANKMYRPENTGRDKSVEGKVKQALEKVRDKAS